MAETNFVQWDDLTAVDVSGLTTSYSLIYTAGEPLKAVKWYNGSTELILLSRDGTNDHDFMPPSGTFIFDVEANGGDIGGMAATWNLRKGEKIYAKTSSNTSYLYMVGYH